jgi:hypothetical protein
MAGLTQIFRDDTEDEATGAVSTALHITDDRAKLKVFERTLLSAALAKACLGMTLARCRNQEPAFFSFILKLMMLSF